MASVTFTIETKEREELYEITDLVNNAVDETGVRHGLCLIFTSHSTGAVVVMENADPKLHEDFLDTMQELIPRNKKYQHNIAVEENADAHIKSALVSPKEVVPVDHGRVVLGQWQGIMFCEFDGPRKRTIHVTVIDEKKA